MRVLRLSASRRHSRSAKRCLHIMNLVVVVVVPVPVAIVAVVSMCWWWLAAHASQSAVVVAVVVAAVEVVNGASSSELRWCGRCRRCHHCGSQRGAGAGWQCTQFGAAVVVVIEEYTHFEAHTTTRCDRVMSKYNTGA